VELTELIKDYVATELLSSIELYFLEREFWETTESMEIMGWMLNRVKRVGFFS